MKTKSCVAFVVGASLGSMLLAGCGPTMYQAASSGRIGCPPREVKITNLESSMFSPARSWDAACKENVYFCSGSYSQHTHQLSDSSCIKKETAVVKETVGGKN